MNDDEMKAALEWIYDSEDQNDYCERSILVAALKSLELPEPDVKEGIRRLRQLIDLGHSYMFVDPPDFVKS